MQQRVMLGQQIVKACVTVGLSQAELAEMIGMSRPGLSNLIRGRYQPTWPRVVAIADALGVSLDFLAGRTEDAVTEAAGRG